MGSKLYTSCWVMLPESNSSISCSSFCPSCDSRASTIFLPKVTPKLSTNCGMTWLTVILLFSWSDNDVVFLSASPQGTICLNHERSTSQLMATPWLLTYRCNWTPTLNVVSLHISITIFTCRRIEHTQGSNLMVIAYPYACVFSSLGFDAVAPTCLYYGLLKI